MLSRVVLVATLVLGCLAIIELTQATKKTVEGYFIIFIETCKYVPNTQRTAMGGQNFT